MSRRMGPGRKQDESADPNPDGVAGRGQRSLGYGYAELKEAWLELAESWNGCGCP
jgi:hypothetical protein